MMANTTIPCGTIGGDRQRALVAEACISGQQQYMESLMGTAGLSLITEEQITNISFENCQGDNQCSVPDLQAMGGMVPSC